MAMIRASFCWYLLVWSLLGTIGCSALNPLVIKGYKFFDSETGEEFVLRGIDYYPRPNSGPLNINSVDYFTLKHQHIWLRDIPRLVELGVNAIRLYAVDPTKSHDAFMCALNNAGIYVVVALARDCPVCAVTRDQAPDCYPPELKRQGEQVISNFAKYQNTLGFSAGNEVNHFAPSGVPEWNGPCQKKFLRDMRAYIASCPNMRKVPVGLVAADSGRTKNTLYYNCQSDPKDPYEHAEWFGLNTYVNCDGNVTDYQDAEGFKALTKSFSSYQYSIPAIITEFGCLSRSYPTVDGFEGQRTFDQARWLLEEPKLRDQFAGGFVFEYSIELQNAMGDSAYPFRQFGLQNYGVGYLSPEDCDDKKIPCEYSPQPCFENLKRVYHNATISAKVTHDTFVIPKERQGRTECPKMFPPLSSFQWKVDRVPDISCPLSGSASNFTCPANVDELMTAEEDEDMNYWDVGVVKFMVFCAGVVAIFELCVWALRKVNFTVHRRDNPSLMTIVIPSVGRGDSESHSRSSQSDESTGLLSMQNWAFGDSSTSRAPYQSVASDLTDLDNA